MNFEGAGFQPCKEWVKEKRDNGVSWEQINLLCTTADNMEVALKDHIDGCDAWPEILTVSMWHEFIDYYKNVFIPVHIQSESSHVIGIDTGKNYDFHERSSFDSAWMNYKASLP